MTQLSKLLFSISVFIFFCFSIILHFNISSVPKYQDIDSKAYISNALTFSSNNNGNDKNDPYYALGYAFFISLIYKFFGINNDYVAWIQVLLSLLTAFFLFRMTRNFFGEPAAVITVIFFSFNIGFLVFSQFILTEILLTFLLVLFIERFSCFFKTGSLFSLVCSGFILGLSVAVKPAAIYFIFPLGFLMFLVCRNNLFNTLKLVLLLFLSFYIPVCGYMLFNKINYGNFQVAPLGNENLYLYLYPKVLAQKNGTYYCLEKQKIASMLKGSKLAGKSWTTIKKQFYGDLKKDPMIFVQIWLKNVFKTCVGLFTTNLKVLVEQGTKGGDISFFKTEGTLFKRIYNYITDGTNSLTIKVIGFAEAFWTILRYLLCLVACMFLFFKKKWSTLLFFVFYIFYFSMITGHDGCARFRMMFEPVLLSLSALGFWNVLRCKTNIL